MPALAALAVVAVSACGGGSHVRAVPGGYVPPSSSAPQSTAPAMPATTESGTPTTTGPSSTTSATTDPSYWNTHGTATWDAAQFVMAEKGYAWEQPGGIGGWVLKAKPYCTPSYWAALDRMVLSAEAAQAFGRGDSGDAALWQQVQSEKETLFIEPTDAFVITEASVSPTQEWVRVTYNTTDVSSRNPDPAPQYGGQEDVIMSKVGGQWLASGEANAAGEG